MLKHIGLILLTYLAMVLETGVRPLIAIGPATPVFLPLVLLVVIFTVEGRSAVFWAASIGLLADCLTPEKPGIGLICATITLFIMQRRLFLRPAKSFFSIAINGFGTVFGFLLMSRTIRIISSGRSFETVSQFTTTAGAAFYSMVIGMVVLGCFLVVRRIFSRILPSVIPRRASRWEMLVE